MYRNTRKKAANYNRLKGKDPFLTKYLKIGMPSRYWEDQDFEFVDIKVLRENNKGERETYFRQSAAKQKKLFKKLLEPASFNESYLISVSSETTEDPALAVSSHIAKTALRNNCDVLFWNAANYVPYNYVKEHYKIPDVLVVYNLTSTSSFAQLEKARNALYMFEDSLRIVCSAGKNPVDFCEKSLRMGPDISLYVNNLIYTIKKSF